MFVGCGCECVCGCALSGSKLRAQHVRRRNIHTVLCMCARAEKNNYAVSLFVCALNCAKHFDFSEERTSLKKFVFVFCCVCVFVLLPCLFFSLMRRADKQMRFNLTF